MSRGAVVFAHGSRIESANEAVRQAARGLAAAGGIEHVEAAFLELGRPDLNGAVERLVAAGVREIVVLPYFLTPGTHLERDLPRLAAAVTAAHPGVKLQVAPPLDGHPALVTILTDRARAAGF